ncbi:SAM-dependent methyltransferase [Nocardiopsis sp. CNT-189]|uniref:SAM-dependent methyltransferase n=1 Tax=Nocardiopsis oceanisediminis TaxID=2816862 RepID=UPI003B313754
MTGTPSGDGAPSGVDTTVAHSARVWNYWLGGKDNYPVDRELGDRIMDVYPQIVQGARADRGFLVRSVGCMAREEGVRQFLDIGTGLPTHGNTHEVAQEAAPDARVVYVDNDPMVLVHARALLAGTEEGATEFVDADLREPEKVLEAAGRLLDFDRPIGLTVLGTIGHIPDFAEARALIGRYVDALPSGSLLALCDLVLPEDPASAEALERWNAGAALPYRAHTPAEIASYFDGLELLDPGVVPANRWRPESGAGADVEQYCGLARKP